MDEVLVARARAGDREAFEVLIRTEAPSLLRLAMAIVLDRERAADVAQDALIAAWQQLHQLRDPARFDAWLRRIVINRSRNALRERRPYRLTEGIVPAVSMPLDERPEIEAALRKLDPRHREVVALFYLEERTIEEIATVLGLPTGTVKSRLHTARARLRESLAVTGG